MDIWDFLDQEIESYVYSFSNYSSLPGQIYALNNKKVRENTTYDLKALLIYLSVAPQASRVVDLNTLIKQGVISYKDHAWIFKSLDKRLDYCLKNFFSKEITIQEEAVALLAMAKCSQGNWLVMERVQKLVPEDKRVKFFQRLRPHRPNVTLIKDNKPIQGGPLVIIDMMRSGADKIQNLRQWTNYAFVSSKSSVNPTFLIETSSANYWGNYYIEKKKKTDTLILSELKLIEGKSYKEKLRALLSLTCLKQEVFPTLSGEDHSEVISEFNHWACFKFYEKTHDFLSFTQEYGEYKNLNEVPTECFTKNETLMMCLLGKKMINFDWTPMDTNELATLWVNVAQRGLKFIPPEDLPMVLKGLSKEEEKSKQYMNQRDLESFLILKNMVSEKLRGYYLTSQDVTKREKLKGIFGVDDGHM